MIEVLQIKKQKLIESKLDISRMGLVEQILQTRELNKLQHQIEVIDELIEEIKAKH